MINKVIMSEADVRAKYIDPSLRKAGWDEEEQIRREKSFTDGRIIVKRNKATRAKRKAADYILNYRPNYPVAIVEAKNNTLPIGEGMDQAKEYGEILDIPFIYTSNGENFVEFDRFTGIEREIPLDEFPSPEDLWARYTKGKDIKEDEQKIIEENYFFSQTSKSPRYYQRIAINRTIEAIAKGQNRILLVMATGTGKTYTAFQIIWRLWKARTKKRILFLADRNILVDQTMTNDFRYFEDKMIKISRNHISKSHEIYLGLYQSMTGSEDWQQIFKEYSSDFFDLIVVDECHRGSAREDSAWREVLEYFSSATQIGMTATPKETKEVSNINYFGEPIYIYSLKQGIEDGFLAPYKVIRYALDKDVLGFRPYKGQTDRYCNLIEDKEYFVRDFDRTIVLSQRTKLVAKAISEYLKENDRFMKTIVFCENKEHAIELTRYLGNENSDLMKINPRYVTRIMGDNEEGKRQLDNFIDPKEKYPVIATTSKLLTTGVDAKTCKLIVLDSNINSMTEFKQIIGRGTRIDEDYGKTWFTILDFRGVTYLFADPDFDGEPIIDDSFDPTENGGDDIDYPDNPDDVDDIDDINEPEIPDPIDNPIRVKKFYVDDCEVVLINKRIMMLGKDGKLINESFEDYTKKSLKKQFRSLDEFLNIWNKTNRRNLIIKELEERGIDFETLKEEIGANFDEFDIICHLAFDIKPITKKERVEKLKKGNYLKKYSGDAREILEMLLDKYSQENVEVFENISTLRLPQFSKFGSLKKIMQTFESKENYNHIMEELTKELYL
ncbi:EcoAI/FtnUII family type I restriction enzme subunit R [Fusobacterium sp.]|uniref:EcoAI/FtnUII family type I restriction enzme subunit R n=1 Tax=Fusobacterium sp. TaxID=68766 RepID=UPI0026118176|nr:DEAD/DEAH box helicase family protein [Fusobacterium sp.]